MFKKYRLWIILFGTLFFVACQPTSTIESIPEAVEEGGVIEITRVVATPTEEKSKATVTPSDQEEELIEVTRLLPIGIITMTVTPTPEIDPNAPKELVVCMAQEPDTLYPYGGSMLVSQAVQHAIFENNFTTLSYSYQAQGLEYVPSLADGTAVINIIEANAGTPVIDTTGYPITLADGVEVINAYGETVVFDGTPIEMEQMVVDFVMKPRVWSDGTPVTADDSVYSYELATSPDAPASKFFIDRTASYEATGELSTRWVGLVGYLDSTYFTNFWQPLPRHAWQNFNASELLEAEVSSRLPIGDGPFAIQEWIAGDSIRLVKNEHYYRADEGLPYLDSVTYKFIPDTNQLIAQLLSGQCDIGTQDSMDVGQSPFLIEAESNGLLAPYFQTGTVFEHIDFGINSYGDYGDGIGRPDWFEDVRVRQAITMCTDRQSMVDNILYGRSEVIHSFIPSVHPLYPNDLTEWPYNVEWANILLDEAGLLDTDGDGVREATTGEPFVVMLGTSTGAEMREQLTQIFKENMRDCGIDVELLYLPANEWFADGPDGLLFGRRFDLGAFAWLVGNVPSCQLYISSQITGPTDELNPDHYQDGATFGGWGAANGTGWVNEEYDFACNRALAGLQGTTDYEEGHKDALRIFSEELPVIPLFLRLKVATARPEVVNFGIDPTQNSEMYNIFEIDIVNK